jgi:hypothetical protein
MTVNVNAEETQTRPYLDSHSQQQLSMCSRLQLCKQYFIIMIYSKKHNHEQTSNEIRNHLIVREKAILTKREAKRRDFSKGTYTAAAAADFAGATGAAATATGGGDTSSSSKSSL